MTGLHRRRLYCDACRLARRRVTGAAAKKRWLDKNPGNRAGYQRKAAIKWKYGLTEAQVAEMHAKQGGICAIPGCTSLANRIDHCHDTGKVRGLLCHRCNVRLSGLEDVAWRISALAYLEGGDEACLSRSSETQVTA